tara:strand:+ start:43 stop:723 length:681 start_codon:yes stop_codon:yes gene_type:complete
MKKQIAKLINGPVGNFLLIAGAVYFVFDFFDLKIVQDFEVIENITEDEEEEYKWSADINGVVGGLEYNEIENWCRKKDSNNILNFNDCMEAYGGDTFVPVKEPDTIVHNGVTYTASRVCPDGQNMYWQTKSGFLRKSTISEIGCMTKAGNEAYWRQYNLQKAGAPKVTGGGSGYNFSQQQQIHNNRMNILQNKFNQQQLQYQQNYQPSTLGGGGLTTPGGGYYYSD